MSFGVGLGDLVLIIQGCIKAYDKITGQEDQLDDVGDRLGEVLAWVKLVRDHVKQNYSSERDYPEASKAVEIVDKIKNAAKQIKGIFSRFEKAIDGNDIMSWFGRVRFAAGNSSREIETLITTVERKADNLDRFVAHMDQKYLRQQIQAIRKPLRGTVKTRNIRILFVDEINRGLSIVAQGYTELIRSWTRRANQPWYVTTIHSAGIHVRYRSENGLWELQDRLEMPTADSGQTPGPIALASLFDNKSHEKADKQTIQQNLQKQPSRGLSKNMFQFYDYIFVFKFKTNVDLQKLKAMVRQTYGNELVAKDKGKIVMIGEYSGANSTEVYGPAPSITDNEARRKAWNRTTGRIKVGMKGWLKQELDWSEPS